MGARAAWSKAAFRIGQRTSGQRKVAQSEDDRGGTQGSGLAIVEGFRAALEGLSANPDFVAETGKRARKRVHDHFSWRKKAEQVSEAYAWVLGRGSKPYLLSHTQPHQGRHRHRCVH